MTKPPVTLLGHVAFENKTAQEKKQEEREDPRREKQRGIDVSQNTQDIFHENSTLENIQK